MEIVIRPKAQKALSLIAKFVEDNNTQGSGIRFIEKFSLKLSTYATENTHYAVCKNKTLSFLGF